MGKDDEEGWGNMFKKMSNKIFDKKKSFLFINQNKIK